MLALGFARTGLVTSSAVSGGHRVLGDASRILVEP